MNNREFRMVAKNFSFVLSALALCGCAINSQDAKIMPGVQLSEYKTFFVIEEDDDKRNVGGSIVDVLADKGFSASIGSPTEIPESTDILVRYDAKWSWDVTFYLLGLNIRFLEAGSLTPLATSTSEHSSITRKTRRGMVEEVLTNIFIGTADSSKNDYNDPVVLEDLLVKPAVPVPESLPIKVDIVGYGVQLADDETFDTALRISLDEHRVFDSISADGNHSLVVALNGLETNETHLVIFGSVIYHNVTAAATWVLKSKDSGEVLFASEITAECPEEELGESRSVTDKTACAIRENLRSGIGELASLRL